MVKPPETHACADCLSARRNIRNYKTVRTSQYHVPHLGLFLVHQFDFWRWILLLFTRWKTKKTETINQYWTQVEQNLQERQKKLNYTSAWTWDQDHKTSLKFDPWGFYRALFFPLIFVLDRGKAYGRSAHQELTFEWAKYTHTHEAQRTHDASRATESSSFQRSPRIACPLDVARRMCFARSFVSRGTQGLLARRVYFVRSFVSRRTQGVLVVYNAKVRDVPENYLYWCFEGKQKKRIWY